MISCSVTIPPGIRLNNSFMKNVFCSKILGMVHSPDSVDMYIGLAQRIERILKTSYSILIKIFLPGIVVPSLFRMVTNYFIYNLDDEAFLLPCPMLYVKTGIQISHFNKTPKSISFVFQDSHSISTLHFDTCWYYSLKLLQYFVRCTFAPRLYLFILDRAV